MVKVAHIQPESIASELGIEVGTELVSVNGRALEDFLDWEFLTAEIALEIEAKLPNGELVVFDIGGNKYRLIAYIRFEKQIVYIKAVLTHRDYDKGAWKS